MACQVNSATLVGFLQQFASVQSSFGDESVVVFFRETSRVVKSAGYDADSLELRPRIADGVFINGECLCEELVANLLKSCLIGDFAAHYKEA